MYNSQSSRLGVDYYESEPLPIEDFEDTIQVETGTSHVSCYSPNIVDVELDRVTHTSELLELYELPYR